MNVKNRLTAKKSRRKAHLKKFAAHLKKIKNDWENKKRQTRF